MRRQTDVLTRLPSSPAIGQQPHLGRRARQASAETTGEVEAPGVPMGQVEPAAMPWSYAVALHLELDPAVVLHAGGYRGRGPDLLRTFGFGAYPGLPVLVKLGLADGDYPHMLRWLAP